MLVEKQKVESAIADVEAKDARARYYYKKKKTKTPKDHRSDETLSSYGTLDIRNLFSLKLPATTTTFTTETRAADTTETSTSQELEPESSDSLSNSKDEVDVEELNNLGTAAEQAELIIQETSEPLEPQRVDVTTDIGECSQTDNKGDEDDDECSFLCECSPGKSAGT